MNYNFKYYPHTRTKPLDSMPYAQARVLTLENGDTVLQSYDTIVCGVESSGDIFCNGLYSATTRKHIGAFAKEFNCNYYAFKYLFNGVYKGYNVYTGVIAE